MFKDAASKEYQLNTCKHAHHHSSYEVFSSTETGQNKEEDQDKNFCHNTQDPPTTVLCRKRGRRRETLRWCCWAKEVSHYNFLSLVGKCGGYILIKRFATGHEEGTKKKCLNKQETAVNFFL